MGIRSFLTHRPQISDEAFIDPSAVIIGQVEIKKGASIWPTVVLRGDVEAIYIGEYTNIQDATIVHVSTPTQDKKGAPTHIGNRVTVGHRAIIHGCTIEDDCLIGMGAIILDDAVIGEGSLIGAGSLVTGGKVIPPHSLVLGSPAKVIRAISDSEFASFQESAKHYAELAIEHYKNA